MKIKALRRLSLLTRRWWRVVKGPPPKKHGVIPYDKEKNFVEDYIWLNSKRERPYLYDYSLCLRPGRCGFDLREIEVANQYNTNLVRP